MIGSPQEPVVEESRETILAQLEALEAGTIPVVMLPIGSTFLPAYHSKLRHIDIPNHAGAGRYIFDPKQIGIGVILATVKAGRHHELLGHMQSKAQIGDRPFAIVSAKRADGVVIQDSMVMFETYWMELQIERLRQRFPGAIIVDGISAPRILEARTESREPSPSVLKAFQQDKYRIGNLQAIGYLRTQTDIFPEGFLGMIYQKMKVGISGKPGNSWLNRLFCGMTDVSYDTIVPYLASRPLCIMGIWKDGVFEPAGFIFPTVNIGMGDQKAAFAGYGFFREWWGTEEQKILAMLGISFFFVELGLVALNGVRYADNCLTTRFLTPFGFQDTGILKKHLLRNGKLVDAIPSTLLREDFESYVESWLIQEYERDSGLQGDEPGEAEPTSGQHALFP